MMWQLSYRADPASREIADRHYNRQSVGSDQFVPPGRCVVLYAESDGGKALWVTSWPFAEYVKHAWAGAWVCSIFRNEGCGVASTLIVDAIAATRWQFGDPPALGMVTFLDRSKVHPTRVRGVDTWGRTWIKAGFTHVGETKGGLMAMRIEPHRMPAPRAPLSLFMDFFG